MQLRKVREAQGKTLSEAAAEARISIGSLSEYERGIGVPRPPVRAAISQMLGVDEDGLDWPTLSRRRT